MRQRRSFLTFTLALLFCLSLAACGAKQYPMEITVVNRTTYPIADIRISLTSEEDWRENRLETTLAEGESTEIDLGVYTEGQLNEGFSLQFYGEDGEPINPDYDPSSPMFLTTATFLFSRRRISALPFSWTPLMTRRPMTRKSWSPMLRTATAG